MTATEIAYGKLLTEALPRAIHSEREYRRHVARIEQLMERSKLTAPEERLLELLAVLVDRYEDEHHAIEDPDPVTMLKELMSVKGMSQAQLSKLLGSSGIASEVLSGKRALSKTHIRKLSQAFHVPADLFI